MVQLYRKKDFDLNVRHFHEKLREGYGIGLSYTGVKLALQGAGREEGEEARGASEAPVAATAPGNTVASGRERAPMVSDQRWYDLVEAVDDASSETYYASWWWRNQGARYRRR